MAWKPTGGGPWGGGGGPWGGGPSGPSGQPDIEEMLRRSQEKFRRLLPGGLNNARALVLVGIAVVVIWLATGFYRVQPGEQGVALFFGEFSSTTPPGLHWWWPTPIGEVLTPNVEQANQITVGFRSGGEGQRGGGMRDVPTESLMLTSDQNIIDIDFLVQWRIKNAADYLFNMKDPQGTVKIAAESAIREVIGQTLLEEALTTKRQEVDDRTRQLLQAILDRFRAGVLITEVKQLKVDPPPEVIDAFNDVQRARQDKDRLVNEAQAYANDILPRAKGEGQRIIQEATGYREKVTFEAQGEASRFLAVYDAYLGGREVTRRRLYLERMQDLLSRTPKVVIDNPSGGSGVVPYLPLPEVQRRAQEVRR